MTSSIIHPAYLYIGPTAALITQAEQTIKSVLCPANSCNTCTTCMQIKQRQHYLVRWIAPENNYTMQTIEPIFETIKFQLNQNEHFFFVLEHAELLTIAVANSLLKSLEEPPMGYHFILLSAYSDALLPTIVSRCVTHHIESSDQKTTHKISKFFTDALPSTITEFMKEVERAKLADRDMLSLIDQIQVQLIKKFTHATLEQNQLVIQQLSNKLNILEQARLKLPMPGSSKLFLRNMFIQFKFGM